MVTYRSERDEDPLPSGHLHHGRVTVKEWLKKHHLKMCHVTVMYMYIYMHAVVLANILIAMQTFMLTKNTIHTHTHN